MSAALVDGKYVDAIVLLAEMRIRNQAPKLGALCRWVRDLDVVSGLSSETPDIRTETQLELLRVMDMILRVTGPVDEVSKVSALLSGPLALQPIWDNGDTTPRRLFGKVFWIRPSSTLPQKISKKDFRSSRPLQAPNGSRRICIRPFCISVAIMLSN